MSNRFKDILFSIVGITAIATFLYFNYVSNYFSYFNIDISLTFLNNIYGYCLAATITIIITIPLFTTIILINSFFEKENQNQNNDKIHYESTKDLNQESKSIFKNKYIILIFSIVLIIITVITSNVILFGLIKEFIGLEIKLFEIFSLIFMYSIFISIYAFLKKSISKDYGLYILFILAFALLFNLSAKMGYNSAKENKHFLITEEYLFVYNTNEYGIGCKYKIDDDINAITIDTSKYVKMDINGLVLENRLFEEIKLGRIEENNE